MKTNSSNVRIKGYYAAYLDHSRLGFGSHRVIAYTVGRSKKVHVLNIENLKHATFSPGEWNLLSATLVLGPNAKRLAANIENRRKRFNHLNRKTEKRGYGSKIGFAEDAARAAAEALHKMETMP